MTSLILGLVALVCAVLGYIPNLGYFSFVSLIFAIIAWITGKNALAVDPYDSKAKAGKIIGMVITILAIIGVVVFILGVIGLIACMGAISG